MFNTITLGPWRSMLELACRREEFKFLAGAVLHGRSDIPGSRCPPAADLQLMRHFVGSVCYVMYRNMGEKYKRNKCID